MERGYWSRQMRAQRRAKEVERVCRVLAWLKPDFATEVLQEAYRVQLDRQRQKAKAKGIEAYD